MCIKKANLVQGVLQTEAPPTGEPILSPVTRDNDASPESPLEQDEGRNAHTQKMLLEHRRGWAERGQR